jgi:hypothetical protein
MILLKTKTRKKRLTTKEKISTPSLHKKKSKTELDSYKNPNI